MHRWQIGDLVVFQKLKASSRPGPRAKIVSPAPHGETYTYLVDKLWIVEEVRGDGMLVLRTRRGKRHVVAANDARMHPPTWWQRLRFRGRFPRLQSADAPAAADADASVASPEPGERSS